MARQEDENTDLHAELAALRQRVQVLETEAAEYEGTRALLREEHSFRQGVIERAAEGICVCHAVAEHPFVQFTVWNSRMTDITGCSMEEINRLGWYQSMYPDPELQAHARQRMADMREGENLRHERWEITRADGEKRTRGISTSLLKTDDGLIHVLGLMQDVTDEARYRAHLERRVLKLEDLLPICAQCKKIRDDRGVWHQLEAYVRDHSEAEFTHGLCSHCATELFPEVRR